MTNVGNRQTCTIGHLNLILAVIALMNLKALKIISQVIRSPSIQHPRKVDGVSGGRVGGAGVMILIIALAAVVGFMAPVLANLAPGTPAVATPTSSAVVVAGVASSTLPAIAGITSIAVTAAGVAAITALAVLPWLAMFISRAPPPWEGQGSE